METGDNLTDESIIVVNECVDNLQKLVKLKTGTNLSCYIGSIKGLLRAVSTQERAMKYFISSSIGGIPLLVSILEHCQDQHIKQAVVMIMKEMLSRKAACSERAQILCSCGAVNHLLRLIVKSQQPFNMSDEFISTLYAVASRIGKKDKKFATKARLLGMLPVTISHLKLFSLRPKVLNSILMFLKRILASPVNATHMSKAGLLPQLLTILDSPKKKMTMAAMCALESISVATRSRYAARQFVKQDVASHLLNVLFNPNHWPGTGRTRTSRVIRAFNAVLNTLIHMTEIKSGRESLCATDAVTSLLSWSYTLTTLPGDQWDRMVYRVSLIVQRCLPPRPLPVQKLNSSFLFTLPEKTTLEESVNSEPKNDIYDSDSPLSSLSSSLESDRDSDQESDPFADQSAIRSSETIRQCKVFFEELKELKPLQSKSKDESLLCTSTEDKLIENSELTTDDEPTEAGQHSLSNSSSSMADDDSTNHKLQSECGGDSWDQTNIESATEKYTSSTPKSDTNVSTKCLISELMHNASVNIDRTEKKCVFTASEVRHLMESAKEETRSQKFLESTNTTEVYMSLASQTASVIPFIKVAYPDTKSSVAKPEPLEKLLNSTTGNLKNQIFKHTEEMASKDVTYNEIYNLDKLVSEPDSRNTPLSNSDEIRISSKMSTDHLSFESRFESGNLRKVFWKGGGEYDLILSPDINSTSHHQWFYFEVSGMTAGFPYVINIINMEKTNSLFNDGMCPLMFSVKSHVKDKRGWMRTGSNICYFRNHYIPGSSKLSVLCDKPYYSLTFTITFPYANDVCYLAYHYPYTFTTLQTQIHCWLNSYDTTSIYCKKDELCKTLAGNSVPVLTITAKPPDGNRQYIFLSARVHPGESNSSWAMKGSLDFLFSNKPSAQRLREMFIFKIVPMLNPDGVINGSHRCSLSGQDLNRQWITPNINFHPTIYHTKALLHYLNSLGRTPLVFCDYHGHSRRRNVFLYGCNPEQSWWSNDENKLDNESYKIIPVLMHHMAPAFCLDQCCFNVERNRESTARITVWRQFDVALSYTMECTYGGCDQGLYAGFHIGITQLEETGMKLCHCFGKLVASVDPSDGLGCTLPIDTSVLLSTKTKPTQQRKQCYSSSSSISEDDCVEFEDSESK